jgi:Icc-related predicted phosphoesterase
MRNSALPAGFRGCGFDMTVKIICRGLDVTRVSSEGGEVSRYRLALLREFANAPHRGLSLRIVAFSDWRVQEVGSVVRFLKDQVKPDLILYAGDDIQRFRPPRKNLFQQIAKLARYGLCAVAGNDDDPATRDLIGGRNVYPVHSRALVLGRFAVVGVEGAPLFPNDTQDRNIGHLLYPERVLSLQMKLWNSTAFRDKKLIIVSHAPPFGVLDFAVRFGARNIGSRPLREFLESSPNSLLCICGHVHRCGGQSAKLGKALVVNAASHDSPGDPGKVVIIQVKDGTPPAIDWHLIV